MNLIRIHSFKKGQCRLKKFEINDGSSINKIFLLSLHMDKFKVVQHNFIEIGFKNLSGIFPEESFDKQYFEDA